MPIPNLDSDFLPPGMYDCDLAEIEARFAISDWRKELFENLSTYINKVKEAGIGGWLIVDGSYVTSKEEPGDIDVVLVISDDCNYSLLAPITYWETTILGCKYVKEHYSIDLVVGLTVGTESDFSSNTAITMVGKFQRVKGQVDMKKGILRVVL